MADSTSLTSRQVDDTYPRTQRAVLTSIALGVMLVPLNSTMIAIALPDVNEVANFQIVFLAVTIAACVALLMSWKIRVDVAG